MARLDHLFEVHQAHIKQLLQRRNVLGAGIGLRIRDGELTDEPVIGVTVGLKSSKGDLEAADVIPDELEASYGGTTVKVRTDVTVMEQAPSAEFSALGTGPYQKKRRPLQPGYSMAADVQTAGTLGCFVSKDGQRYALTNNHVLQTDVFKPVGHSVWQPGRADQGTGDDKIGYTGPCVPIVAPGVNTMDAALVKLDQGMPIDPTVPQIGAVRGWYNAANLGWKLRTVGRTSGYVEAHCTNAAWAGILPHSDGTNTRQTFFTGQQIMHVFPNGIASQPGDSGSVWVTEDGNLALLGHQGNQYVIRDAYTTPLGMVLEAFRATPIVGRRGSDMEAAYDTVEATAVTDPDFSTEVWKRIAAQSEQSIREI